MEAKFFPEYVNKELLTQYINNMNRYAYSFQMIMLCKRIQIYYEAQQYSSTGGIAIIDRSILRDMAFARMQKTNGNFTNDEWNTYLSFLNQEIKFEPAASLFLNCSTQTSVDRIKLTGIDSEINGYTIEYLEQLNQAYSEIIHDSNTIRHIIIEWNGSVEMENNYLILEKFL